MKTLTYAAAFILVLGVMNTAAQPPRPTTTAPDVGVSLQVDFPGAGNYDLYDYGIIAEIQFRDWFSGPWGYELALGYGDWKANRNASRPGASLYDFSGSLEIIPVGGGLLYHLYANETLSLILNAGLRYMINDSSIKARNRDEGGTRTFNVDIGDALLFSGAVNVDYAFNPDIIWSAGLGYRTDISRGSLKTEWGSARDSIMESFFLETALRIKF